MAFIINGAGDQTVTLGDLNNLIIDLGGDDIYEIGDGDNLIFDIWGDDEYTLGDGFNIVIDWWGNDVVRLGNGGSRVFTGWGDDYIYSGAGADLIDGDIGHNTVDYAYSLDAVKVDLFNGTASGGYAEGDTLIDIDNIVGSNVGRDYIWGNDDANEIYGMGGDDILQGGAGADLIDGGAGWDYARYDRSAEGVNINLVTGVHTGGDAEGDVLVNIEAVTGSAFNDTLYGDATHNHFYAGEGDDWMVGGLGQDQFWGFGGADTMAFLDDTAFERRDLFRDFDASEGDALDISAILEGYDALSDAISDFVQVTDNGTNTFVAVDADGGADNFIVIAELYNIIGLTAEDMEANGNLITTV